MNPPTNLKGYICVEPNGFWQKRINPSASLHFVADQFNQISGKVIVEIGTGIHGKGAGNSILIWNKHSNAKQIIAIDVDQKRIDQVKQAIPDHSRIELACEDGKTYLKRFKGKIDLLYLDFWTPDQPGQQPGTGRANAYRETFQVAKSKMRERSMILIDDTDHIDPWKQTHIVPMAREEGYTVVYTGRQTLLFRE